MKVRKMISTEEFKKRWAEPLAQPEESQISDIPFSEHDRLFLLNAGLPKDAAPYLSFTQLKQGLKPIYEIWGNPQDYSDKEKSRLEPYLVFGSDGSGNPIAVDTNNECQIFLLDHENRFKTITFMNTGISQLAEFLLLIKELIHKTQLELSDEQLDEGIPDSYKNNVFDAMQKIDVKAIEPDKFWKPEIEML
ncbi:MAG: SUKH-4 family immunity protein [Leptospirales bacterium]